MKRVRLTESELRTLIESCIAEEMENEGLWDNIKAAGNTFKNSKGNWKQRFSNAKQNFSAQQTFDDTVKLGQDVRQYVNSVGLNPSSTSVAQLLARLFGRSGNVKRGMMSRGYQNA